MEMHSGWGRLAEEAGEKPPNKLPLPVLSRATAWDLGE